MLPTQGRQHPWSRVLQPGRPDNAQAGGRPRPLTLTPGGPGRPGRARAWAVQQRLGQPATRGPQRGRSQQELAVVQLRREGVCCQGPHHPRAVGEYLVT